MTVQDRIAELLQQRNWSKYKLAKEAGFYPTTVYDWFNEKHFTPDRNSIESICLALGITQAEFYSRVDESELDPQQTRLLELFANVPPDKRQIVFELMQALSDQSR